jgi:hypothetical protein
MIAVFQWQNEKGASLAAPPPSHPVEQEKQPDASALAGLEALLGLIDNIDTTATTDELVVAMALQQRLQRVADLHD